MKTNPKAFWKYANSKLKTRTRIDDLDREDGTKATTNREKAEEFNKFFSSVFNLKKKKILFIVEQMEPVSLISG